MSGAGGPPPPRLRLRLEDAQFATLSALLERAAGLVFDASRRDSLGLSVAERMHARALAGGVDAYLELLGRPGEAEERQALIDEVTIQETHFFRNPPQVRALRRHVLPELLRAAERRGDRRLRIWSAGCSTGEEPYSIAIMLRELLPSTAGWDLQVLGTDVSSRALAAARTGEYGARALQLAQPTDLTRWFSESRRAGEPVYGVRPEVRELVDLRLHNLVTDPLPVAPGELDLVLCRNVTIYFARPTTRALMARLHDGLRDGGYLFLGHSETLWQVNDDFRLVTLGDAFVYRRLDAAAADERRRVLPDRRTAEEATGGTERRLGPRRALDADRAPEATPGTALLRRPAPTATRSRLSAVRAVLPRRGEARADGRRAADREPPTVEAARAALDAGDYAGAARLAGDVADRAPLVVEAHLVRGLALSNAGDDAAAIASLRKAVYLDPLAGFAQFLLAGALARTGQREAAAAAYRAAAAALPRTPSGDLGVQLGGRRPEELAAVCLQLAAACAVDSAAREEASA